MQGSVQSLVGRTSSPLCVAPEQRSNPACDCSWPIVVLHSDHMLFRYYGPSVRGDVYRNKEDVTGCVEGVAHPLLDLLPAVGTCRFQFVEFPGRRGTLDLRFFELLLKVCLGLTLRLGDASFQLLALRIALIQLLVDVAGVVVPLCQGGLGRRLLGLADLLLRVGDLLVGGAGGRILQPAPRAAAGPPRARDKIPV